MRRLPVVLTFACLAGLTGRAYADPIQVQFNVSGFGPTTESEQSFTKVIPGVGTLTFESLDQNLAAQGNLHWDADDGNGYADGFGVRDFPDLFSQFPQFPATNGQSYSQDEIEGNERLRLTFAAPVQLLSFNITDFFYEDEALQTGLPVCLAFPQVNCYQEFGEYSIDGGLTWVGFLSDLSQIRGNLSNGVLTISVNQFVSSLILRAPGATDGGLSYPSLMDYSLAGIEIEQTVVPEPSSLLLLGSALGGWTARRWRQTRAARSSASRSRGNVTASE